MLKRNGEVIHYYGESGYEEDGWDETNNIEYSTMVEQPRFYYKVVPLKTEKIDGADGYHLRKARYYISDTPKPGFKVHPAFIQNGVEVDKIYLSAYEGCITQRHDPPYATYKNDEQTANFDTDWLHSTTSVKPASGTTQSAASRGG